MRFKITALTVDGSKVLGTTSFDTINEIRQWLNNITAPKYITVLEDTAATPVVQQAVALDDDGTLVTVSSDSRVQGVLVDTSDEWVG
jgi:hypothetical protein